jgi:hypothetical protein
MKSFIFSIIIFINFLSFNFLYSQNQRVKIQWGSDTIFNQNNYLVVCSGFDFEFKQPFYYWEGNNISLSYTINDLAYEKVTEFERNFILTNNFLIDTVFHFDYSNSTDLNVAKTRFKVSLFKKTDQGIFKLNSFQLVSIPNSSTKDFNKRKRGGNPQNSVLSDESNKWHKFYVSKDGFYKITYDDLKSLGYFPEKDGFNSFHLFGNASGVLPELNSDYKDEDLVQNSVQYVGSEDGVFNTNDYILFYSPGPNIIDFSSDSLYVRRLNYYSNSSGYFLTRSTTIQPKTITIKNYLNQTPTFSSNIKDVYAIHENEDTSLVYAGKRWYGELFDYVSKKTFEFNSFNTELQDVVISVSGATNAKNFGSYVNVYLDAQFIGKINLTSVSSEYIRVGNSFKLDNQPGFKNVVLELVRNSPDVKFFLDKIEINARKANIEESSFAFFTDKKAINKGLTAFTVSNVSNTSNVVVDVTDTRVIYFISSQIQGNSILFHDSTNQLSRYKLLNYSAINNINSGFFSVSNQNLHGVDLIDMIIVTPELFKDKAIELRQIHSNEGLRVQVVTTEEIYNEFSSGTVDPTAIKQFARCIYKKQLNNPGDRLKYLLLFGDGTFDPKNRIKGNNYFIPTYQFDASEDFLSAMVSDDYFGMMDDNEAISGFDLMDISVGRMLISNNQQADQMIAKIKKHMNDSDNQLEWMSKVVIVADDEEGGYFLNNDTEPQSNLINKNHPEVNIIKLYSDAFQQVSTAGGERYPSLNEKIDKTIYQGCLVMSYVGHGGPSGAAEERFITIDQISAWENLNRLPLFVSSTCEFTKYDDPTRISAGEVMYLNPKGGAIALMTTTRPVFFGVNTISGDAFYKNVFQRDTETNQSLTFGEIFRRTKNQSGSSSNRRSFTLIGDPALKIKFPELTIVLDSINGVSKNTFKDTVKALSKLEISGFVSDNQNQIILKDGIVDVVVYDKPVDNVTLGQNVDSPIIDFKSQTSILFKGRATVKNGRFHTSFILPKDINYQYGNGKISVVSNQNLSYGIGKFDSLLIGGLANSLGQDTIGPSITMSFDKTKNISNGIVSSKPTLYITLSDESGINVSGAGIGHQISLVTDDDLSLIKDLSDFYISDMDTYKSGKIEYPITNLSPGKHKIALKAWDVMNNSSTKELEFYVSNTTDLSLERILNYPNPFTTNTKFYIEQNKQTGNLKEVKLEIYTIGGKLVNKFEKTDFVLDRNFTPVFDWNGTDLYGDKLAKGVYIYRVTLVDESGKSISKNEKLVIF